MKTVKVISVRNEVGQTAGTPDKPSKEYTFTAFTHEDGDGQQKTVKVFSNNPLHSLITGLPPGQVVDLDFVRPEGKQFYELANVSLSDKPLSKAIPGGFQRGGGSTRAPFDSTGLQVQACLNKAVDAFVGNKITEDKIEQFAQFLLDVGDRLAAKKRGITTTPASPGSVRSAPKQMATVPSQPAQQDNWDE